MPAKVTENGGVDDTRGADAKEADMASPIAVMRHTPTHVRNLSLTILATVAVVFALQWAQKFLIPLFLGVFIAYTLNPLVVWLERIHIPRLLGSCVVMIALVVGLGQAGYSLRDEFQSILQRIPVAAHQLSQVIVKTQAGQRSTLQKMQVAATELEKAAGQATGTRTDAKRPVDMVVVTSSALSLNQWLWEGSMGAMGFMGQAILILLLVFFLLLSGGKFKRKLVNLVGPSGANQKIAVHILSDINISVQSYMFMLLVTNTLMAILMWFAFRWIGLENAGAWAVAGGLLHIIPYFGPLIIAIATGLNAFVQFESLPMMLLVAASTLGIATLIGTFVTTWMTGKIARMNAAAVFIMLLFWGWLWGVWGLLLGIPITVIIKVIAKHIDGMQPVTELLGD
ncbi:MAG: AI-2E family transporter [Betaproteobacteria bacterium]|nr:AI-2E family transporter [Betaproteobacteria bacterium]